jgi:Icc-related predicted phosphoesterase
MEIACASDTHGRFGKFPFPAADVLVMAGDLLPNFSRDEDKDAKRQLEYLPEFNRILGTLPYRKIFVIPGNHDWVFQLEKSSVNHITNGTLLIDQAASFEGINFYGSPWQVWFYDWAFNFPRTDGLVGYPVAKATWEKIPDNTNVLVVHGPPLNILDKCMDGRRVGCPILRDRVLQLKELKLGVYGHIHPSYGKTEINGATHVNASVCDEAYDPVNPIQVITI